MDKKQKDIRLVVDFISTYCRVNHVNFLKKELAGYNIVLCEDCLDLAEYAIKRRNLCPKDPKPACKKCPTPCYGPEYKEKICRVMRFSGMFYVKKGRFDYIYKYFF